MGTRFHLGSIDFLRTCSSQSLGTERCRPRCRSMMEALELALEVSALEVSELGSGMEACHCPTLGTSGRKPGPGRSRCRCHRRDASCRCHRPCPH